MRQAVSGQQSSEFEKLQALPFMVSIDDYLAAFPNGVPKGGICGGESLSDDMSVAEMKDVLGRIRMQLRYIISSVRNWQERHGELQRPLRRKYSSYEGALCRYDLARHWALYRYAMGEYAHLKNAGQKYRL